MSRCIVKLERFVVINAGDCAEQSAEQHGGAAHFSAHRIPPDSKGLEGDIERRDAAPEIKRAFNALGGALDIDVREFFKLSVIEKAVFIAVTIVADAAGKAERKALTVDQAVCAKAFPIKNIVCFRPGWRPLP